MHDKMDTMLRLPQLELSGLPNGCEIQSIALGKGLAFAVAAASDGACWGLGDNRDGQLGLEPRERTIARELAMAGHAAASNGDP